MSAIIDRHGDLRPWPVRRMTPAEAELVDRFILERGRTFSTIAHLCKTVYEDSQTDRDFLFALAAWHAWGRQSFKVAPVLAQALRETTLERVPTAALGAPYSAIWVETPLDFGENLPKFVGFFLISAELSGDPHYRGLAETLGIPDGTRIMQALLVDQSAESQFLAEVFLCEESLLGSMRRSRLLCETMRARTSGERAPTEEEREMGQAFWGFVSCFLLYLSSPNPDLQAVVPAGLEHEPRTRKARDIHERILRREGNTSAAGFRLTRVRRFVAVNRNAMPESHVERAPVTFHIVRGHFRMQPHGTARAERKAIWVAPYGRGEDGSEELIERTYLL